MFGLSITNGWDQIRSVAQRVADQISGWFAARSSKKEQRDMLSAIASRADTGRDRLRQILNVVFAVGQVVTTYLTITTGSDSFTERTTSDPPFVPAPYTFFVIWTVIYASTIAYAIYQALPSQRDNPLFRRIGFATAAAFAGTSLWLIAAANGWEWLTVIVFFGILIALMYALIEFIRVGAPRTTAERYLVVLPISIFAAWATVGTIANTTTALYSSGIRNPFVSDPTWAVIMLLVAGAIGSFVTIVSRGNIGYALTLVWALIGVIVANIAIQSNPLVATTAGFVAVLILAVWTWSAHRSRSLTA